MSEYWHSLSVEEVIKKLKSSINGLTESEAKERLTQYGFNELEKPKKISPLKILAKQFTNILIIILLAATALSFLVGEIIDTLTILIIVIAAAVLGFFQEYKAEKAIEALKKMLSPTATVIRDSEERKIPAKEIVPGDIIVLEAGDKIPADGRVIEAFHLQVNEAPLTGESVPIIKQAIIMPKEASISDMKNIVFAGTTVTDGRGKAIVVATGSNTEFGKIAKEVATIEKEKTPLEKRMGEVGKMLSKLMLSACFIVIGVGIVEEFFAYRTLSFEFLIEMILFGVALAVAAVPEALPAIVTGTLAIGMREMAKRNAIVRKMAAVETLGCTSIICTDKTGTLTKGEMTVRKIYVNEEVIDVTGVGFEPKGEFMVKGEKINPLNNQALTMLLTAASLCNEAKLSKSENEWKILGDPTEGALIVAAVKAGLTQEELKKTYPRISEIPFSSERKRMTTVHKVHDERIFVFMKGAPEVVLEHCNKILKENGVEPFLEEEKNKILKVNEGMANNALRVLGVAYKEEENLTRNEEELEKNLVFVGLAGMIDPPREEAIEAIKLCKQVKMKPIMITGDHKLTALAIAKEMSIYNEGDLVLTGAELEALSDEEFNRIVDKVTVYARVSPIHKLRIVKAWKARREVVAMTGDGVNDAPALKQADIGVAMGITGTEVSKEASDMVIVDDNFATIVKAIERGRWIYDNIKKYLTYILRCNIVEMIVLAVGVLIGVPLPLFPVQILYINLATDGLPAIALGVGPPDPDIMQRPPRNPKESIFTKDIKYFLAVFPIILSAILLGLFLTSFYAHYEDLARARLFLAFVFFELTVALSSRSLKYSIIKVKPDKFLSFSVLITAIQTIILILVPATREAFKIVYPSLIDIGIILVLCIVTLVFMEVMKKILGKIK
ncbi:cation-translocating P-type ATPase [Candidatus Bathyarchaeota archaeon]|nr:cation-translocating P-type ATPase [Candidatus Bathyarchaeota archaeon]